MKFVSYNIQYGVGLDGIYDTRRIAASLAGADVIALQEVTRGFSRNQHADMVAELEDLFPDYHSAFHAPVDMFLDTEVVDGRCRTRRFQFGNMVLSRHPILSIRGLMLPRSRTYDRLNLQRAALETVIDAPGGPIRVCSIHLDHMSPDERIAQISALKTWLTDVPAQGTAVTGAVEFEAEDSPAPEDYVVLGDFNLQPGSPDYSALFGHEDVFYGRSLRHGFPVDALHHLKARTSQSYSWQDMRDAGKRMLLDYALISPTLVPRLKAGWIDNEARGSDHFPLWIELA